MIIKSESERSFCFACVLFEAALACYEIYDVFAVTSHIVFYFVCGVLIGTGEV